MTQTAAENAFDLAARRLERALGDLETRLASGAASAGDLFQSPDAAKLKADLERAQARERELEAAGAEASAALGRAIEEIRSALGGAAAE